MVKVEKFEENLAEGQNFVHCRRLAELLSAEVKSWLDEVIAPILIEEILRD